ncbi:AbrB/MazE/SpoVT family DNA-binding domain-containing protein [Paenibacillus sp. FSL R7-0337]|uniref:AbrB/MazE/SpoVT family DNA-binding domain-containing protein n=1 Tax=Paenibacillus sp. FSL R7-0337 TaxID=1926588 RepID=UPI00096F6840|nr:AbrB/MazE/SpoVT family DNA-binding domain-containing protein [Paenibacillus sp. FSL R7-0337]OMF98206.1 AbrB family transcriptional regulator [Paenibacillus sp. FSL R7-0337]
MKSTGIVRRIDELGRVVIPMELRRTMAIENLDPLEIFVDGDKIVLKKYNPGCTLCGSVEELKHLSSKPICTACITEVIHLQGNA